MKSSIITSALLSGLAIGNPILQRRDDLSTDIINAYLAVPDVPALSAPFGDDSGAESDDYNPIAAASSAVSSATADVAAATETPLSKRQSPPSGCTVNVKSNYAGTVSTNTDAAFQNDPTIAGIANSAHTPSGYFLVTGFQNLKAAAADGSYKTYTSSTLSFYDVDTCAARCTAMAGCQSFNIYFERDNEYVSNLAGCPDSATATSILIKCAFFGAPLKAASATNAGQYKSTGYHIVIAGSNAYTTTPQALPNYDGPYSIGAASINSPVAAYQTVQTFPGTQPYDPSVCAAACAAITGCVYFDAYFMYANNLNGQFTCTYYNQAFDSSYATNFGQTRSGIAYDPGHSYTYKVAGTPFQPSNPNYPRDI